MSKKRYLNLIWKSPETGRNYTVGQICEDDKKYSFKYIEDYLKAQESGWQLLEAFPDVRKYESDTFFTAFSSRLPDPKRKDIKDILSKYALADFDAFELLEKSSGKLPTDTYEFINPIFPEDETVERQFFIAGVRHKIHCEEIGCGSLDFINDGDSLILCHESDNSFDEYAVLIKTKDGREIGYVPKYYSKQVAERLQKGMTYECGVIKVNKDKNCAECIKVKLRMPAIKDANV